MKDAGTGQRYRCERDNPDMPEDEHRGCSMTESTRPPSGYLEEGLALAVCEHGLRGSWRHKASSHVYQVVSVAYLETDLSLVVVYERAGVTWARPIAEFLTKFEKGAA